MRTLLIAILLFASLSFAADIRQLTGSFEGRTQNGAKVKLVVIPRAGSPGTAIILLVHNDGSSLQALYGERMDGGTMGLMSFRVAEGGEDFVLDVRPVGTLKMLASNDGKPNLLIAPFPNMAVVPRAEFKTMSDLQASFQLPSGDFTTDGIGLNFNPTSETDGTASGRLSKTQASELQYNVRKEQTGIHSLRPVAVTTNLISRENPQLHGLVIWFKDSKSEYVTIARAAPDRHIFQTVQYKKKAGKTQETAEFLKPEEDDSNKNPVGPAIRATVDAGDRNDGVSMDVDVESFKDLFDWAQHSKLELQTGIRELNNIKHSERHAALRRLINDVITGSDEKNNELYMRNVLRRARILDDIIQQSPQTPERDSVSYRLLKTSVAWAVDLYTPEQRLLDALKADLEKGKVASVNVTFMQLGMAHTQMVLDMIDNVPNHEAKLVYIKSAMALLLNDLNRDAQRRRQAIAPVSTRMMKFYKDIENQNPGNSLEGLALYRKINDFLRQAVEDIKTLSKDLGLEPLPPAPKTSVAYQADFKNGVLYKKGDVVYLGEAVGPVTAQGQQVRWWRVNGASVDPSQFVEYVSQHELVREQDCAGELCKGMRVEGKSNGKGTISGVITHAFGQIVEIKADTRNGEIVDGWYANWHIDYLKRKEQ